MTYLYKREIISSIPVIQELVTDWNGLQLRIGQDPFDIWASDLQLSGGGDWHVIEGMGEAILQVLDKIAFHRQSHIELGNNIAVFQSGTGTERQFDFCIWDTSRNVGESIEPGATESLSELIGLTADQKLVLPLRWFRRALNSERTFEILFFSVLATEALTDEKLSSDGRLVTNHAHLKTILGGTLYEALYGSEQIRNNLFHGKLVSETRCGDVLSDLYKALVAELNSRLMTDVTPINPGRLNRHGSGWAKVIFETQFQDEPIPQDAPSIVELKKWWAATGPTSNATNPYGPRKIRLVVPQG